MSGAQSFLEDWNMTGSATDEWLQNLEAAKQLANDISARIQTRGQQQAGGTDASRATAAARKQLSSLALTLDKLRTSLEARQGTPITENERNRRRDLLTALKLRKDQLQTSLRRSQSQQDRSSLLQPGSSSPAPAVETSATAGLENRELLQMQQQVMSQQDDDLAKLEKTITGTKSIAVAINEELGLHERLLDDLDEDVDASSSRMRQAQKKLKHVMSNSGNCRSLCVTILLMVVLAAVILLGFKILSL